MLPEQLAVRIFSFLVPKELLVVCQVRRKFFQSKLFVVIVVVVQINIYITSPGNPFFSTPNIPNTLYLE